MSQNILPHNWTIKKLGDVFTLSAGGDVDKSLFSEKQDVEHPYPIYANALTNQGLYGYSSDFKVEQESITITGRGDIGKVFYRKGKYTPIVRLIVGIPKEDISAKYMSYACSQIRFFNETTGVPQLTVPQVSWYKIAVPPLPEQEKIARILSCWDTAIEQMQNLITEKKELKRGLMQRLLTGRIRLPGFRDAWENKKLGDLFVIKRGDGLSKELLRDGGKNKCILYGELYTRYTETINDVYSKTDVNAGVASQIGDILIPASTTTVGIDLANAAALFENGVLLGGDINILRKKEDLDSAFFAYALTNIYKFKLARLAQGITIVHLYGEHIKSVRVLVPSVQEQHAIADILTKADTEIELLNKKLDVLKEQKKGLMQKLLTGEIRVKVDKKD